MLSTCSIQSLSAHSLFITSALAIFAHPCCRVASTQNDICCYIPHSIALRQVDHWHACHWSFIVVTRRSQTHTHTHTHTHTLSPSRHDVYPVSRWWRQTTVLGRFQAWRASSGCFRSSKTVLDESTWLGRDCSTSYFIVDSAWCCLMLLLPQCSPM